MTRLRRQREKSVYKTLSLLFMLLFLAACGGGGGGGGGSSTTNSTPTLSAVVFSPTSAPAGSTQAFILAFNYTDPLGDLDGGYIYIRYNGIDNRAGTFTSDFAGSKSGFASLLLSSVTLNSTVGNVIVPVWIVDKLGNKSNEFNCTLTQT